MAIGNLDDYIGSAKQVIPMYKSGTRVSIAGMPFTVFDLAGQPGAGVLNPGNTANGIVPVAGNTGYPAINAFGAGATAYLSRLVYGSTVASRITLYDRLFVAGAYNYNDAIALAGQPDYSGRIPNLDYKGTQLWFEAVTAFTGNVSLAVTYTNQDGVAGRTTGVVAFGFAPTIGRMVQLPLQAGDSGVQKIESVTATVATIGTFNVMVLRQLADMRVMSIGAGDAMDMLYTGMPQLLATTALFPIITADLTSTGNPSLTVEIANK